MLSISNDFKPDTKINLILDFDLIVSSGLRVKDSDPVVAVACVMSMDVTVVAVGADEYKVDMQERRKQRMMLVATAMKVGDWQ
ncbi:hypothetical protein C5167_040276 [Papaver somniferum]|uniref:Uncharacterized protein n=1 Tax=Papaver somniferum TaxID=3469 RepID=A0A4Y7IEH9_PAPSO|nr:hypothetical protein C5167_040276 [Papaver somniferum]